MSAEAAQGLFGESYWCDLVRRTSLPPTERAVLRAAMHYADWRSGKDQTRIEVSTRTLAEDTAWSEDTIARAIRRLHSLGAVHIERRSKGGRGSAARHELAVTRADLQRLRRINPRTTRELEPPQDAGVKAETPASAPAQPPQDAGVKAETPAGCGRNRTLSQDRETGHTTTTPRVRAPDPSRSERDEPMTGGGGGGDGVLSGGGEEEAEQVRKLRDAGVSRRKAERLRADGKLSDPFRVDFAIEQAKGSDTVRSAPGLIVHLLMIDEADLEEFEAYMRTRTQSPALEAACRIVPEEGPEEARWALHRAIHEALSGARNGTRAEVDAALAYLAANPLSEREARGVRDTRPGGDPDPGRLLAFVERLRAQRSAEAGPAGVVS